MLVHRLGLRLRIIARIVVVAVVCGVVVALLLGIVAVVVLLGVISVGIVVVLRLTVCDVIYLLADVDRFGFLFPEPFYLKIEYNHPFLNYIFF